MTGADVGLLLEGLGLRGNSVIVHTSLSSFGQVDGGARTVCEALMAALGESGTLLMPAFTYAETVNTTTTGLPNPKPRPFSMDMPVSHEIGVTAETFRHLPGVLRSSHPTHSFAAWGRQARDVLSTQRDNNPLGPLKKLNVVQGHVLLLGTTLQAATAVHLAEERLRMPYLGRCTAVRINAAGYEERVVIENFPGCSAAFSKLEERLDPGKVRCVPLARGLARKIPLRYLVNLATALLESDPRAFICDQPGCASCAAKREAFGGDPASAVG
jgi:aminoglycoside 3-N-acetyltransferase